MNPSSNVAFDLPDNDVALTPEVLDEALLPTLQQPAEFGSTLHAYRALALTLAATDAKSLAQCAAFVLSCKAAEKFAEGRRKSLVDPLNKQVKEHNEIWMPIAKGFEQVWREVDSRLSRYVYAEQQKAIALQQAEIARAAKEKALIEQKAADARAAAEAAAQSGNVQEAAKAEAKADRLELKADMIVADVVPIQPKTLDMGGVTLTAKAPKKNWALPGWDKKEKLYGDDPRLKGLDPAWLIRYCTLDAVRLNKAFGAVAFPAPFVEVDEFGGSTARGGKS